MIMTGGRSHRLLPLLLLRWSQFVLLFTPLCSAYPVILTLDSDEENGDEGPRCLQFSIPEDDDAHVVMMALPDHEQIPEHGDELELWYVEQLYQMTKLKSELEIIPRKLPDMPPDNVAKAMSDFMQELHGAGLAPVDITVVVTSYEREQEDENQYKTRYFQPLVLNHIRKHHATSAAENYEGVRICMQSHQQEGHLVHIVLDTILVSEDVSDLDAKPAEPGFQKEEHLTPLEGSLDQSITAARQVLREYKYMEQREQRMRQTAEGINSRVHYFSYVSVAILFGVTYLQVGYLKRYFKKKKLM